jgi:hypothetical protein
MRATDFFHSVLEAARDAERCRMQIESLKLKTHGISGGNREPGTSGGSGDPRGAWRGIDVYLDKERELEKRRDEDFALIDRACVVLYGKDQQTGGLCKIKGSTWADILWWRYCAASKWVEVADNVGYSVRRAQVIHDEAIAWLDRTGYCSRVMELGRVG